MKNQWKLVISILILILVVIFALQNTNNVTVDLFYAKFSVPLVLVILISVLGGVIIGLVASFSAISVHQKERASIQKELNALKESSLRDHSEKDKEITHLRAQIKHLETVKQNTVTVQHEEPLLTIEESVKAHETPVVTDEVSDATNEESVVEDGEN